MGSYQTSKESSFWYNDSNLEHHSRLNLDLITLFNLDQIMNPFLDNIQIEETFFDDDLEQQCFIDDGEALASAGFGTDEDYGG